MNKCFCSGCNPCGGTNSLKCIKPDSLNKDELLKEIYEYLLDSRNFECFNCGGLCPAEKETDEIFEKHNYKAEDNGQG